MDSVDDANRCVKYLNQSVLEGRYITVEKVMLLYPGLEHESVSTGSFLLNLKVFWLYSEDIVSYVGSNQRWSVHPCHNLSETAWSMASLNSFSNACDQLNIATILFNNYTTSAFNFNSQLNQRTLPTAFNFNPQLIKDITNNFLVRLMVFHNTWHLVNEH